jgi:hypothetical protein
VEAEEKEKEKEKEKENEKRIEGAGQMMAILDEHNAGMEGEEWKENDHSKHNAGA